MKNIKLKSLLKESWTKESKGLSLEEKKAFLEAVGKFNEYGNSVYRSDELKDVTENISKLVETAKSLTLSESEGTFDAITVNRHMKSLNESMKLFEKTAREISSLQQRLEACYEEIGGTLSKYYDIHEIQEALDPVGKEDSDVDNDGDTDKSDEYLKNRRNVVTKAIGENKQKQYGKRK